ncbi:cytochrome P450 [Halomonas sp. Bachu 37]|uniref:cytochrome P450 n=1 Tax=Halomonas kashgarensis TaxID=3084920 RepID=UPI0032177A93
MVKPAREKAPDSTLSLLREGYRFIPNRCRKHDSDIFEARLLLERTLFIQGEDAAKIFYNKTHFTRENAAPKRLEKTLFGEGGVQGLDDEEHLHRKTLFLPLLEAENVADLVETTRLVWLERLAHWKIGSTIVLFDELQEILFQGVCRWAGVPLAEEEISDKTRKIALLIESPAAITFKHLKGRMARKQLEDWAAKLITQVREGTLNVAPDKALARVAWHRNQAGDLLATEVAAVELLNILRPTTAVARYLAFIAHALHTYPQHREPLAKDDGTYREWFVEEVRRHYPFFPCVVAVVKSPFTWQGIEFTHGRRVVLDLYGTNHDKRLWERPDDFDPQRFQQTRDESYSLIPQGGGDYALHHRCPGERITLGLMHLCVDMLVNHIRYEVPRQDLDIDYGKVPTLPNSRFVIEFSGDSS